MIAGFYIKNIQSEENMEENFYFELVSHKHFKPTLLVNVDFVQLVKVSCVFKISAI